jgi:hypothetical protein
MTSPIKITLKIKPKQDDIRITIAKAMYDYEGQGLDRLYIYGAESEENMQVYRGVVDKSKTISKLLKAKLLNREQADDLRYEDYCCWGYGGDSRNEELINNTWCDCRPKCNCGYLNLYKIKETKFIAEVCERISKCIVFTQEYLQTHPQLPHMGSDVLVKQHTRQLPDGRTTWVRQHVRK